jgi:hypothetical protein
MVGDTITLSTFIVPNVAILHYEAIIGLNVVLFVESVHICWLRFRV